MTEADVTNAKGKNVTVTVGKGETFYDNIGNLVRRQTVTGTLEYTPGRSSAYIRTPGMRVSFNITKAATLTVNQ